MRLQVWAWRCDVVTCGHTWLASDVIPPAQCSKCKSRNWHTKRGSSVVESSVVVVKADVSAGSIPDPMMRCPHKEWAEDGEQYRCALAAGHKGKCKPGERM